MKRRVRLEQDITELHLECSYSNWLSMLPRLCRDGCRRRPLVYNAYVVYGVWVVNIFLYGTEFHVYCLSTAQVIICSFIKQHIL